MQVIIHNRIVNYQRSGTGSVVVLLHGWADSLATFNALQATLSESHDVVNVDLPGFGRSQAPQEAWSLIEYALFLKEFLAKIAVNEVHTIIGHSNGGAIAIKALASGEIHCQRLVLLASAGIRNNQTIKKRALKTIAKTGKFASILLPKSAQKQLRQKFYTAAGSDLLVAEHMTETFTKVVSEDLEGVAALVTTPTLLIYGAQDMATPPAFGKIFHRQIKDSQLVVLENCGHFVHHDQSEKVAKAIKRFVQ